MAECFDIGTEAREAPATFTVAGFQFPTSPLFTPKSAAKALTIRPHIGDVILSSYPKCDSQCVDAIVWNLLYMDQLKQPPVDNVTNRFLPCLEMETMEDLSSVYEHMSRHKLPRLYKTYLPFKLIPFFKWTRYIYVIRSPWEACTSYFSFLLSLDSVAVTFDKFFRDFLDGSVPYGSYFKHIVPWKKRVDESNVLVLCREHVEHNPRSAMFTIAAFLGDRCLKRLMTNSELEGNILKSTNWDKRRDLKSCLPKDSSIDFGSLQNVLSPQSDDEEVRDSRKPTCTVLQLKEMVEKLPEQFKDSSIEFLWLNLLKKQLPILFT